MIAILQNNARLGVSFSRRDKYILLGADGKGAKASMNQIVIQPFEARALARVLLQCANEIDGLHPTPDEMETCFKEALGTFD